MRSILLTAAAFSLVLAVVPSAQAGCIAEIHGLCVADPCDGPISCDAGAAAPMQTGLDCIQVYPWSKLCSGDVGGFVCAMIRCDV